MKAYIHTCTLETSCITRVTCKISFCRPLQFYPRSCHTVPPNPFSYALRYHCVGLLLTSAQQQQRRRHEGVNDRGLSLYYVIGLNYTHTLAPIYTYIHIIGHSPSCKLNQSLGNPYGAQEINIVRGKKK